MVRHCSRRKVIHSFTQYLGADTFYSGPLVPVIREMRAELPWNVAGIPPEAREAARAAARREGLSVGEWLTRRILRSFSGHGRGASAMPFEPRP